MTLNNETGKFYISSYSGSADAFYAEGDKDFVKRFDNLCFNFKITNGKLHKIFGNMFYVLTTKKKLIAGLKQCFYLELVQSAGKYSYITDPEDEKIVLESFLDNGPELEKLAIAQAEDFFQNKIIKQKFITGT